MAKRGRGFDARSGRYQSVTTCIDDCLRTGKPSRYIINDQLDSAFYPSGLGEYSTGLLGWVGVKARRVHLCQVAQGDLIRQVTLRRSAMDYHYELQTFKCDVH